ncbi:MAG: fibrobacter succinogenes major paralogous domain-containing protein [Candidatus Kapabacteria bacterium]|nr:fibrobacter succinogenes major paralogous domain-containing protein [Candidatus Kapabacteria bacterium]
MKRVITALCILFLSFVVTYSASKTMIKFSTNASNDTIVYDINDIDKLEIKKFNNNYTMKVYYKIDSSASYQISALDSLKFLTGNDLKYFNIYYSDLTKSYLVSDIDSIIFIQNQDNFETVTIGNQVWMVKNLDLSHYRNGDTIRHAVSDADWVDAGNKNEGAWCYYDNDPANGAIYGKLYNWYAVNDSRGLAPSGYLIPSEVDWSTLHSYLRTNNQYWCNNNNHLIAKSLAAKERWNTNNATCCIGNNLNSNNSSGFSSLPGGLRELNGGFNGLNSGGNWWTASASQGSGAYWRYLINWSSILDSWYTSRVKGFSVRCIVGSVSANDSLMIYFKNGMVESISIQNIKIIDFESIDIFEHNITLNLGWNLISTYVEPEFAALENVFSAIEGSTVIVKNNSGQIYYPEFDINDIGNWDVKQGYQVYMSSAETLTISGEKVVPETTEITLTTGWNMLAYLRDNAMDIEIALASLVADDKLVIAKDNMGNVFYPAFDINMIGDMLPGQGYQIYLISGATLTYPEN